jgi:alcohol dehydrogenase
MLLPAVCEFSMSGAVSRYAQIARCMNLANISAADEKCCRALMDGLSRLYQELEIPSPKSFGIDKASYDEHIEKMANDTANASSTTNNPVIPTLDQIKEIYHKIFYD